VLQALVYSDEEHLATWRKPWFYALWCIGQLAFAAFFASAFHVTALVLKPEHW
jgi:hypothetical protein